MIMITECGKPCLKAEPGKMLYGASIDIYTPKVYLLTETDGSEWVEVDASAVPPMDEEATDEDYEAALAEMGVEA